MTLLDEEVGSLEDRLDELQKDGTLDTIEQRLREDVHDWEERAQRIRTVQRELSPFLTIAPDDAETYERVSSIYSLADEKERDLRKELEQYIEDADAGDARAQEARRAAEMIHADALAERVEQLSDDRFEKASYQQRYDEAYHELRSRFDEIDSSDPDSLGELQDIAAETQELVHKYERVDDAAGAEKAAELHTAVEDAASRVAPIYDEWKKKHITVAALLLSAAIGFWKGHIAREYLDSYVLGEDAVEERAVATKPTREDEIEREEYPSFVSQYATGVSARYLIALDRGDGDGGLYDVVTKEELVDFQFTAHHDTPEGSVYVQQVRTGRDEVAQGSVTLDMGRHSLTGTFAGERLEAAEQGEMGYWEDIYVHDPKMVRMYDHIRDHVKETVVVIGE